MGGEHVLAPRGGGDRRAPGGDRPARGRLHLDGRPEALQRQHPEPDVPALIALHPGDAGGDSLQAVLTGELEQRLLADREHDPLEHHVVEPDRRGELGRLGPRGELARPCGQLCLEQFAERRGSRALRGVAVQPEQLTREPVKPASVAAFVGGLRGEARRGGRIRIELGGRGDERLERVGDGVLGDDEPGDERDELRAGGGSERAQPLLIAVERDRLRIPLQPPRRGEQMVVAGEHLPEANGGEPAAAGRDRAHVPPGPARAARAVRRVPGAGGPAGRIFPEHHAPEPPSCSDRAQPLRGIGTAGPDRGHVFRKCSAGGPPLDSPRVQDLLATADHGRLDVDGCPIAWARWTPPEASTPPQPATPPIVLVHGAGAHLGWWEAVIRPLVADDHTVVTLELSGHGRSGHRSSYTAETWSREVLATIRDVAGAPALLVGHSLGGRVAICAAADDPALVPRLVLVDAPVRRPGAPHPRALPRRSLPRRTHATLGEAVETFRLRPREPVADTALLRRIARAAYVQDAEGWSLRADLSVFGRIPDERLAAALADYPGPITLIHGSHSTVVDGPGMEFLAEAHRGPTELVAIEGHHHLTIDQGAQLAALIAERHARLVARL